MNIFESVRFLDEGQQADEYRYKKLKEKRETREAEDKAVAHRNDRDIGYKTPRYSTISGERTNSNFAAGYKKEDEAKMKKDNENIEKAGKAFSKEMERRDKDFSGKSRKIEEDDEGYMTRKSHVDFTRAADATMRHVRRHPKQYTESVIEKLKMI